MQQQGSGDQDQRPFGNGNLVKEAETLAKFKGRIDTIVSELEKSPASQKAIAHQTIAKGAYGTGFGSADDLAKLYDKVHDQLKTLSQTLGDQVEAMGIAAVVAERGYDGMDAEQAARLKAIEERVRKNYHDPTTGKPSPAKGGHEPKPERSGATDLGSETA
ncbi:hypothetical protein ACH427_15310 [Streptomyces sp. NPDC020379]|uniref:hypothetical protein n=1 Tax=Streptomyces sp. NPDC020379 TaxID=3365071 RepID=UPI0037BD1F51